MSRKYTPDAYDAYNVYIDSKVDMASKAKPPQVVPEEDVRRGKLVQSVELFLEGIGEDPRRKDLVDTPLRVAKMWMETLNGYSIDPAQYVVDFPKQGYTGPVILKNAELYSMCAHHLQPIIGQISIAYLPDEKMVGLSKLLRIARVYAKRLTTQEVMTQQVVDSLYELLAPYYVVVRYEAEHYCMRQRGTRVKGATTVTIAGRTRSGSSDYPNDIFSL